MGNDPFVPSLTAGSGNANANTINNYHSISISHLVLLVVMSALGLALAIGAIVITVMQREHTYALIAAAEKRAVDRAGIAEREARVYQDQVVQLQIQLYKKGFDVRTDAH